MLKAVVLRTLLCSSIIAASAPASSQSATSPEDQFAQAEQHRADGRPAAAVEAHEQFIANNPSSPLVDDSLLALLKCANALEEPLLSKSAFDRFESAYGASELLAEAKVERGDFLAAICNDRIAANRLYYSTKDLPVSTGTLTAQFRLLKQVRNGRFSEAINALAELSKKAGKVPQLAEQIQHQVALFQYQVEDHASAAPNFAALTSASDSKIRSSAAVHSQAIETTTSVAGFKALHDKGIRWRETGGCRDRCWQAFYLARQIAEEPAVQAHFTDEAVPASERAEWKYNLALINFELGDHDPGAELAQSVLRDMQPTPAIRALASYMLAFHMSHCGHFQHAAQMMRAVIDEFPDDHVVTPLAYDDLARFLELSNDPLGAALACEEFYIIMPYRKESELATRLRNTMLVSHPELKEAFYSGQQALQIRARDRQKQKQTATLSAASPPTVKPSFASNAGGAK